jgi:hypothetical protein
MNYGVGRNREVFLPVMCFARALILALNDGLTYREIELWHHGHPSRLRYGSLCSALTGPAVMRGNRDGCASRWSETY